MPDRVAAWALRLGSLGPMAAFCLILYVTFRGRWGDYSPWILLLQAAMIPCPALMMLRLQRLAAGSAARASPSTPPSPAAPSASPPPLWR